MKTGSHLDHSQGPFSAVKITEPAHPQTGVRIVTLLLYWAIAQLLFLCKSDSLWGLSLFFSGPCSCRLFSEVFSNPAERFLLSELYGCWPSPLHWL